MNRCLDAALARRGETGEVIETFTVQCGSRVIGTAVILFAHKERVVALLDVFEGTKVRTSKKTRFRSSESARVWLEQQATRIPCRGGG